MNGLPILSIMTWAPFVSALIIMAFGAARGRCSCGVTAAIGAGISLRRVALAAVRRTTRRPPGFQFGEQLPLVPSLGISYQLAVDGMSVLLVLLTAIIIFAGVFASWTVKTRGQEFYALLLLLVTGVFGVFVSLDLFVFFLFYEIAVLPMYLLIGIWGSIGRRAAAGHLRLGVRAHRRRHQGIRGDEADAVPAVRVGVHPRRHLRAVRRGRAPHVLVPRRSSRCSSIPTLQTWVFLAFYVGFGILAGIWPLHTWSPDGHASAPTAVSMLHAGVLMKLGAYGVVRLGMGLLPEATHDWAWLVGAIACINIVYGALSAMAQTDLKYVIAYSSVSHMGVVMLGAATLTVTGLNGAVFQMFAHGIMTGLFFALVGLVYEKAHSREIFKMGGFAHDDAGHCHGVHDRRPVVARAARDRRLRRRVPDVPRRLDVGASVVAVPGRDRRVPDVDLRAARRPRRSSGDRRARTRTSSTCLMRRAPSGWRSSCSCSCSCCSASRRHCGRRRSTRRPCRS